MKDFDETDISPEDVGHECNEECDEPCEFAQGEEVEEEPKKRKYVRKDPNKKITRKRSAEHNEKIAKALRGRSLDPSHRDAISQSMIGNTNRSGG